MNRQETLQKDLEKAMKKFGRLFTRLRTPSFGHRGVRYPGDYILWLRTKTVLVECKERKKLPLAPSDIRQLKFMKDWRASGYQPSAYYLILVRTEDGRCRLFTYGQAVEASDVHRGLRESQAILVSDNLYDLIFSLEELC